MPEALRRALESGGAASSDHDLNPEIVLPPDRRLRAAAVLVPVWQREGGARVILTKREAFTVPLAHLLDLSRYRVEQRLWRGGWRRYYVVPYGPYYIWGATARILHGLARRMQG